VGDRLAYGDVRLEAAAFAVGRLDAALSGHPPLPVWTFRGQLDTARRHAGTDGRRVDLHRLAAVPHGLPLRVAATLSLAERGGDITALAYTVEPRAPGQSSPIPHSGIRSTGLRPPLGDAWGVTAVAGHEG
jgi:hypothetical protein